MPIFGAAGTTMFISLMPPGQGPCLHSHNSTYETFMVLEGTIEYFIGDPVEHRITLNKWDVFSCPPRVYRGFRNVGTGDAVQLTVMIAFGILVFKVPVLGPWPGLVAMVLATAAVAAAFGMAIAAFGRTEKQVHGYAILVILVMSALGGSMMPIWIMPQWMQDAASFTITKWAVNGLEAVTWRGLGYGEIWQELTILCGITLGLGVLAIRRFRWD